MGVHRSSKQLCYTHIHPYKHASIHTIVSSHYTIISGNLADYYHRYLRFQLKTKQKIKNTITKSFRLPQYQNHTLLIGFNTSNSYKLLIACLPFANRLKHTGEDV